MKRVKWILLLSLAGALLAILHEKYQSYRIAKLPVKFVYESDSLMRNPILYIKDLSYKDAYLESVKDVAKDDTVVPINFPLLTLPGSEKIYIKRYLPDSLLVEFFDPDYSQLFDGFTTGYVYRKFVHDHISGIKK